VNRIPPQELAEAAAWMLLPFLALLVALLALAVRWSRKRDAAYAAEQTRIEDQAAADRLAAWRKGRPS